jgi:hypothetical protein
MPRLSRSEQVATLARMLSRLNGSPPASFDDFAAPFRGRSLEKGEYFSQNPFSTSRFSELYLEALRDHRRGARCVAKP